MVVGTCAPHLLSPLPAKLPWVVGEDSSNQVPSRQSSVSLGAAQKKEELRCVITVMRQ